MSHHIIQALGPQALEMQAEVLLWFAAGHDVLWIPIAEFGDEPDAIARAQSEAEALGQPYLLESIEAFAQIPDGVRGWVFPAHLDDTYTVAQRIGDEVSFGTLRHPAVQHDDLDGAADAQHSAVLRAVRVRGHRRAHPRQDCGQQA